MNEESKQYLIVDVSINPQRGSKEISIASSVSIFNNTDLELSFYFLINGSSNPIKDLMLKPGETFPVPLLYLESKTEVKVLPKALRIK
jgi:hypothetical protein